jgi:hypothetical protein
VAVDVGEGEAAVARGDRLVACALQVARRRGVALVAGSSFGFDTTRVYLTAGATGFGRPFLRIAAGTEHRGAIDAVADVLATALTRAWSDGVDGRGGTIQP